MERLMYRRQIAKRGGNNINHGILGIISYDVFFCAFVFCAACGCEVLWMVFCDEFEVYHLVNFFLQLSLQY